MVKVDFNLLSGHVIATLPDSFSERKILLATLLAAVPLNFTHRMEIKRLLHFLEAHEKSQLDLPLLFQEPKGKSQ